MTKKQEDRRPELGFGRRRLTGRKAWGYRAARRNEARGLVWKSPHQNMKMPWPLVPGMKPIYDGLFRLVGWAVRQNRSRWWDDKPRINNWTAA